MGKKKLIIAVVAGGNGSEYEISLRSGEGIMSFLDKKKFRPYFVCIRGTSWRVRIESDDEQFRIKNEEWCEIDKNDFSFTYQDIKVSFDFAYIIIHGTPGENGPLQGYFSLLGIPYSSCNVLVSALTFNKYKCNRFLHSCGIKVASNLLFRREDILSQDLSPIIQRLIKEIGLPCFVKVTEGGSSIGCIKATDVHGLEKALQDVFNYGDEAMCEQFIPGREFSCGIYQTHQQYHVLPVAEIVSHNDFFDYDAKYNDKGEEIVPAHIPNNLSDAIQSTTLQVYKTLGCQGIVRVDFIVDNLSDVYVLEVNTTPGMTNKSIVPKEIRAAGNEISAVLDEIIEEAYKSSCQN